MSSDIWLQILDEHGPLTSAALKDLLPRAQRWSYDEQPAPPDGVRLVGEEFLVRESWLQGRLLTHRLSDAEVTSGLVDVDPDWLGTLDVVDDLTDEVPLAEGGQFELYGPWRPYDGDLPVPEGSSGVLFDFGQDYFGSRGLSAGDLVGLSVDEHGQAHVTKARPAGPVPLPLPEGQPCDASAIVWRLAFAGLLDEARPPLTELIEEQGLIYRHALVHPADWDFSAREFDRHMRAAAARFDLSRGQALANAALTTMGRYPQTTLADLGISSGEFAASLADQVGARMVALSMWNNPQIADSMMDALRGLSPVTGEAGVSMRWLEALCLERNGEVLAALEEVHRLFVERPDWVPAIETYSSYAQSAGDAQRCADLLEPLTGTRDIVADLRSFLTSAAGEVARNDRCPCGSGRKYKQCHLGKPLLTPQRRADWVMFAATQFLYNVRPAVVEAFEAVVGTAGDHWPAEHVLLEDMALMEGGVLRQYRAQRAPLMPSEDLAMIDEWLAGPCRSAFRVLQNSSDAVRVLDLIAGEERVVETPVEVGLLLPGSLWVSRISNVGGRLRFFGGTHRLVPPLRSAVSRYFQEPDLEHAKRLLAAIVARREGLEATLEEGDYCEARVSFTGSERVLDDTFVRTDHVWFMVDGEHVHGWIARIGDDILVQALSGEGLEAVLARIREVLPGSEILHSTGGRPQAEPGSSLTGALEEEDGTR